LAVAARNRRIFARHFVFRDGFHLHRIALDQDVLVGDHKSARERVPIEPRQQRRAAAHICARPDRRRHARIEQIGRRRVAGLIGTRQCEQLCLRSASAIAFSVLLLRLPGCPLAAWSSGLLRRPGQR